MKCSTSRRCVNESAMIVANNYRVRIALSFMFCPIVCWNSDCRLHSSTGLLFCVLRSSAVQKVPLCTAEERRTQRKRKQYPESDRLMARNFVVAMTDSLPAL